MWVGSAYGLVIGCDDPLPGFASAAQANAERLDVFVYLQKYPSWHDPSQPISGTPWYASAILDEQGTSSRRVWRSEHGFHHVLYDGTQIFVDLAGTKVWMSWPDTLTLADTVVYLQSPMAAFLLLLRGITALHASVIHVDSGAVAFLGDAGTGKSTTAAIFAREGFRILSDDVCPLRPSNDGYIVHPGYPHIKLLGDAVARMFGAEDALPFSCPTWDKREFDLVAAGRYEDHPLPLTAIYILGERAGDGDQALVGPIRSSDAFLALLVNTHANSLLDEETRARQFAILADLLIRVPVRQAHVPSGVSRSHEFCDAVQANVSSVAETK